MAPSLTGCSRVLHYGRLLEKLDQGGTAIVLHNLGILIQLRGHYQQALGYYERSLKIKEESGDRSGVERGDYEQALEHYERSLNIHEELGERSNVALSFGQIGQLMSELGRYDEAFRRVLTALSICLELESRNIRLAIRELKTLRAKWGHENFDSAWKEATGTDLPEWFNEESIDPD